MIGFVKVSSVVKSANWKSRLSKGSTSLPRNQAMPETADRIESLFAAAISLPPGERGEYLEKECTGDSALRDQVLALLRAHDRAGHVIDRPVNGDPDQTAGYAPASEQPGTIIAGRYKLLEEIGQGGMGTVWAAEQTTPVRRKVALKLIRAGMDSRSVLARFEAERQALALMDHPNIAKVLDGGLTESGRPYFVMEYVKGVPITDYCDATRLSVEERLNLFVQVCSALQHAHQKGIIHRDLKPSNILVAPYDDKPVPKVIDFGLAKAMHQSLTEKTLYTAHEMVLGTPLYMSPEQAQLNNLDVDTRADIYSLGVLLYELLTGTTPIERKRFKEAAWDEVRRMIREEEPPRPSLRLSSTDTLPSLATFRHTEPAKLKKLVRGELDWIVMKALEKDRTRRYETASGFARDIQRYLDDEVVEARPPSPGYRIGKFVRRHKGQVIGAGLVMLALLTGIAGTTWGLFREARANTRLSASLDREQKANSDLAAANAKVQARYNLAVDAIKTFHTGVSEDFLLKEEKFKDLRNRLLKSASDFYGKLGGLLGKESDFASRRALGDSNFELAELTRKVGRREAALAAHQTVLAAREALAAEPEADAGVKADVGRGLASVANLLYSTGKSDEALATCRRSESLLAGLAGSDPDARAALAYCRTQLARLLMFKGQNSAALATFQRARADQEALAAVPGASNEARSALAETVRSIGFLLWVTGKWDEAVPELRAAMGIYQKLTDENPDVVEFRHGLGGTRRYLGEVLPLTGKPAEGEAQYRTSLAIHQKLLDDNPAVNQFRRNLGICRKFFVLLLLEVGKPAEAESECRKALALFQKLVDDDPTVEEFHGFVADCHRILGVMLLQAGEQAAAEIECRKARALSEELAAHNPPDKWSGYYVAVALDALGDVVRTSGRAAEAKSLYDRAIALQEVNLEEYAVRYEMFSSTRRRGLSLRDLGDVSGAVADTRRALKLWDEQPSRSGRHLFETACCHATLAGLAGRAGSGVSAGEGKDEATIAMEWLGRAVANGYRNTNQLRIESALDPLRNRPDYKKLVAELEKNAPPQQAQK
jgi:eukaryotic-like serine/threonine-protein kinase